MNLWPLRALVSRLTQSAHGVAATVTRPAPDNTPITTTGIWLPAMEEARPYGTDFQRREPRRVFVMSRDDVATLPRGTIVIAPERTGDSAITWRVDGLDQVVDPHNWRAILVQ